METRIVLDENEATFLRSFGYKTETGECLPQSLANNSMFMNDFTTMVEACSDVNVIGALRRLNGLSDPEPEIVQETEEPAPLLNGGEISGTTIEPNNKLVANTIEVTSFANPVDEKVYRRQVLDDLIKIAERNLQNRASLNDEYILHSGDLKHSKSNARDAARLIFRFFDVGDVVTRLQIYGCIYADFADDLSHQVEYLSRELVGVLEKVTERPDATAPSKVSGGVDPVQSTLDLGQASNSNYQ